MEEQILELLHENLLCPNRFMGQAESAKEITSHVMEFILWLSLNSHIATSYSPMYYLYAGEGEDRHIDFTKEHHVNDVYQYWLTNIKDK
jgi:hypothetical protein